MRLPQSTLAQNFDEYRRACSHFCLWRINSPCAPTSTRFSPTSSPLMALDLAAASPALHSFLESDACIVFATLRPRDLHAVFIRRRFGKLMPRSCSGKPQSESVANRATSILGWGPYRAVWGSSCRLAKLSRNCEYSGQRGLYRV